MVLKIYTYSMMNKYHHNSIYYFALIYDQTYENLKIDFSFFTQTILFLILKFYIHF